MNSRRPAGASAGRRCQTCSSMARGAGLRPCQWFAVSAWHLLNIGRRERVRLGGWHGIGVPAVRAPAAARGILALRTWQGQLSRLVSSLQRRQRQERHRRRSRRYQLQVLTRQPPWRSKPGSLPGFFLSTAGCPRRSSCWKDFNEAKLRAEAVRVKPHTPSSQAGNSEMALCRIYNVFINHM
jgi:hypothetical protein